jgi:hypothetical protein
MTMLLRHVALGATVGIVLGACSSAPVARPLTGFRAEGSFGEQQLVITPATGVTATIVAPARLDIKRPVELILYALPNGNTTAQTMGRQLAPGMDWHFDIQHIAAQTRALRERGLTQAVVAYLEADSRSWPEWRRRQGYPVANAKLPGIVDSIVATIGRPQQLSITLTGHSGGGSFMFGLIEAGAALPAGIDRVAFLDANYNFEPSHGDTLRSWLSQDPRHVLVVLAYDDREIMLDGRKVVSDSGGTWRATERMLNYLRPRLTLTADTLGDFHRWRNAQVEILRHPNPANRILHTEMIGEMNGYMHALLVRRAPYDRGQPVLAPARAYTRWVER